MFVQGSAADYFTPILIVVGSGSAIFRIRPTLSSATLGPDPGASVIWLRPDPQLADSKSCNNDGQIVLLLGRKLIIIEPLIDINSYAVKLPGTRGN